MTPKGMKYETRALEPLGNMAAAGALFIWLELGETNRQRDKVVMTIAT